MRKLAVVSYIREMFRRQEEEALSAIFKLLSVPVSCVSPVSSVSSNIQCGKRTSTMNSIIRTVFKSAQLRSLLNPARNVISSTSGSHRQIARNLWYMCNSRNDHSSISKLKIEEPSTLCSCGCGSHAIHTKGICDQFFFFGATSK